MLSGSAKPECIASLLKTHVVDREGQERRKEAGRKGKVLLRVVFDHHECACT